MNIKEIDKWLDNEYGVSYTRLEELHDFVVEQDLKHREEKDKEIERLNKIRQQVIDELFDLKNMIYKPETREINFDVQNKISSIIKILGSGKE